MIKIFAFALMLSFYSIFVIINESSSFEVRFAGFYGDRLYPYGVDDLKRRGHNITSLVEDKEGAVLSILDKASQSSKTNPIDGALLIRCNGKQWLVGRDGDILFGKRRLFLNGNELYRLKKVIFESFPQPEESLRWREEKHY